MQNLLEQYKAKQPEIVFEWKDAETEAEGWIVINSLRNGAAGGGTRMRKGLTKEEVISLAKVMEVKFSVCGPAIGGAKSGINFDPSDPRRNEVLQRWYAAALPILKTYYGTGGDLNVDELKDVIPITERLGLWHPQEGIVNGHLNSTRGDKVKIIGQLRYGCAKIVEDPRFVPDGHKYAVADLITGFGVAESVRHFYEIYHGTSLEGKTAIIQGWGNVASAAASYLSLSGARILGIIDREGGVISREGLGMEEVKELFVRKQGNKLVADELLPFEEVNEKIWSLGADIFIPGAASKLVTREQVEQLVEGGAEVISCGANVPFVDDGVFFGPTAVWTDQQLSLIPDFIANCGMARVFAYFMKAEAEMTDEAIFSDVSATIRGALERLKEQYPDNSNRIASNALSDALQHLMALPEPVAV
ncbi:Glu/Leu/Phe/Val dehydrogenase dimerization domain-containing protein [Phaeodactylibacter xiamenensis]|jgi:glutamate dehydrogenase/leucine dehydrogenase|uniref:Amino acid dehydrogenase n=1 Tax=Phaeodactylibacter xiamenensis TaxID=1524460 RepID=A0A098SBC7_9BACT|nr:Glu/Leu/Phe/Val dehydrogenase dimerization domain-containing protein [Phaeodactylibacter xiamenensis]KGE88968.1 amino acid dehydrogenase [Phaeodactylibacter xiamenensis]MCR9052869.1 Glu/Leu/Phe/Val dehydrogenase [bacterium]